VFVDKLPVGRPVGVMPSSFRRLAEASQNTFYLVTALKEARQAPVIKNTECIVILLLAIGSEIWRLVRRNKVE